MGEKKVKTIYVSTRLAVGALKESMKVGNYYQRTKYVIRRLWIGNL